MYFASTENGVRTKKSVHTLEENISFVAEPGGSLQCLALLA